MGLGVILAILATLCIKGLKAAPRISEESRLPPQNPV